MENLSIKNRINEKIIEIGKFVGQLYEFTPSNMDLENYKKDLKTKAIYERGIQKRLLKLLKT